MILIISNIFPNPLMTSCFNYCHLLRFPEIKTFLSIANDKYGEILKSLKKVE